MALFILSLLCAANAACGSRDGESETLAVRPTVVATVAVGDIVPWANLGLPGRPVKAAPDTLIAVIVAPGGVTAGEDLRYEVRLKNGGADAYHPADCPIYLAWLHTVAEEPLNIAGEPLALNCLPSLPIQPGEEARFAMEFPVPPSTPAGTWVVAWGWATPTDTYGTLAKATIEVRGR